ncbi:MAG: BCCT family transporter, partial [Tateyamaria sp.]
ASVDGAAPKPSTVGLIAALGIIMGMSILSAVSGVGRGIKYLSNLNLVLSFLLLLTFVVFGSFLFALTTYGTALADYIWNFIPLSFEAYNPLSEAAYAAALPDEAEALAGSLYSGATNAWGSYDGFVSGLEGEAAALDPTVQAAAYEAGTQGRLFGWQSGWTTFYWAWWIAFSPFVGLFLARISKGRTVREFILGCVIAPALVCFAWLTILGGTAVNNELQGVAEGAIIGASNTNKLFVSLGMIVPEWLLGAVILMCVVLIMTFLVTSADSGILVMNTIMSGGAAETGIKHRIIWGLILTGVIGSLLVAGALDPNNADALAPLQDAMIVGALPFTFVMVLMAVALAKALFNDSRREKADDAVGQPAE